MNGARCLTAITLLCLGAVPARAVDTPGRAAPTDTTSPPRLELPALAPSLFDVTSKSRYILRHAYSFDHFLEYEPSVVLVRRGPIGKDASVSRFGIGRGRATVLLDGIEVNDPQDGVAPLVHFPVSALGSVSIDHWGGSAIEGRVRVDELDAPPAKPSTFIELSKGTNDLRQRRVRFASARSKVGIDLGYDELLNDGYSFDAAQLVGRGVAGYGESRSRYYTMRVRGEHPLGDTYSATFRKFTSAAAGDLESTDHEQRRSGHLATARATLGRAGVVVYQRGHAASYPDSHTVNQTTGARASLYLVAGRRRSVAVEGGFEGIDGSERHGGVESRSDLYKSTGGLRAAARLGGGLDARAFASFADPHGMAGEWGGGVDVARVWTRARAGVSAARTYRMPSLGELFSPAHASGGVTISGNKYVDPEHAFEVGARVAVTWSRLTNEVRWTSIATDNPIEPAARTIGGTAWVVPENSEEVSLQVVEERLLLDASFLGVDFIWQGGATFTDGDRTGFFSSTPRTRVHGSVRVGGNLFDATSALHAGVEYLRTDERRDFEGALLPAYEVFNFTLDGRLLDADIYMALVNAFNERYRTDGDYLMTPRTFLYGIAWTLWE